MKRFAILLIATISTILAITAVATSNFSSDDKHPGHHQEKDKAQSPAPSVDGSVNPNLIPEAAAYEILFRLLSTTDPEDKFASQRKSAYLRVAGFSDAEAAAISNAAYEYKRQIDPLDTEVDQIKTQHWPNPDRKVKDQLKQLQKQKENIISSLDSALKNQLDYYNGSTKLNKHIADNIKKKTKGFIVGLPTKKTSSIGDYFSSLFTVAAQAFGCDTSIYIYADTVVDMPNFMVYGNSSFSQPYDNCGHIVTLNTNLNNQSSPLAISLTDGTNYFDGTYQTSAIADAFCPVANQSFYGGENSDTETIAGYLTVNPFGSFIPTSVRLVNSAGISMSVTASQNANGSFNAEFSYQLVQGNAPVNIEITGSGTKSISGGATNSVSVVYLPISINSNPTKIKAHAVVTSSLTVYNGTQTSASILTITP